VVVAEFVEIESGRKADRPQLAAALAEARKRGAAVAVAKLDRIARDAELVLRLSREAEANGMAGFLFCDLPDVDATTAAGRMVLSVMASVAEFESRRISERTRDALAAAKERGVKLGGLRPGTLTRTGNPLPPLACGTSCSGWSWAGSDADPRPRWLQVRINVRTLVRMRKASHQGASVASPPPTLVNDANLDDPHQEQLAPDPTPRKKGHAF
jgi:hypothetical protein